MKKPDPGQSSAENDSVIVDSKIGRRRFMRAGTAFLLAGGSMANAQEESENFRSDCDSQGGVSGKNAELEGSDSDEGATADRPGCGRRTPPTLTEYNRELQKIKVGKITT